METTALDCNYKPKFKPKSLCTPKWDGDMTTLSSWKTHVKDYFSLIGLNEDREQLVILLHDDVLPETLKSTLYNCISTKELFDSLDARFSSESAKEMRRLLEVLVIKNYTCCSFLLYVAPAPAPAPHLWFLPTVCIF